MNGIAVFGEMLVDHFPTGPVVGGAPFNVARHLAALGHDPLMLGAIGDDDAGRLVLGEFDRYGMRRMGLQVLRTHGTGAVDVLMNADGGHRFVIRGDAAWDHATLEPARAALASSPPGWLYAGTLALRSAVSRSTQLALMREHPGSIFLDINWREDQVMPEVAMEAARLARVLKTNEDELPMLCRWFGIAPPPAGASALALGDAGTALARTLSLQWLLLTLGPAGALACDGERVLHAAPRRSVHVVDTVGAGDAFAATALAGLNSGWPMMQTLERAVDFAGRICEVRGAVPADMGAYEQWTADWSDTAI